ARAAEIPDHLPLAYPGSGSHVLGEARHMRIGRHIAVGMLELDVAAIARLPIGDADDAIARSQDRRADPVRPIDARVRPGITEDRMAARPEPGSQDAFRDRFAEQELLQG